MKTLKNTFEKSILSSIEKIVRSQFSGFIIKNITISEATDFEDDKIYHVTVVFDSNGGFPKPEKMAGLVRHVRSGIEDQTETFPIFRFISEPDAKRIGIATA